MNNDLSELKNHLRGIVTDIDVTALYLKCNLKSYLDTNRVGFRNEVTRYITDARAQLYVLECTLKDLERLYQQSSNESAQTAAPDMRRFVVNRKDFPILEGVWFANGRVAVRFLPNGDVPFLYDSMDSMKAAYCITESDILQLLDGD